MRWLTLTLGIVLAFFLTTAAPGVGLAQTRVDSFDRLSGPRIALPDNPGDMTPLRQLCPVTIDACEKYWAYTGHFVRNSPR